MTFELSRARAGSFASLLAVLVAAALVLGWDLGKEKLANWDEAIYAEVARQVYETGNWMILSWNGEPWFEKPPLLPWLTAVAYYAMGVGEASARIVSAFAGVGLAVLTFFMAGGHRRCWTGLLAAGVLLGSDFLRRYARMGTTDILLTSFCYVALAGYLSVDAERRSWGWLFVGAGVGLGFMTKSVAVLVVPAAIALDLTMGKVYVGRCDREGYGSEWRWVRSLSCRGTC